MSRRARAVGFACAAALCAGLAAAATGGPLPGDADRYGQLREVVVAAAALPEGRPVGRRAAAEALELRRVPERFVAPDALASPAEALGRRPAATIPAGGYLLDSQFDATASGDDPRGPRLAGRRRAVEIAVAGGAALAGTGHRAARRVDVVVTTESAPGRGAGRTFVAAAGVRLLELNPTAAGQGAGEVAADAWIATLALTRAQALRLIHAQSFAREVRLLAG